MTVFFLSRRQQVFSVAKCLLLYMFDLVWTRSLMNIGTFYALSVVVVFFMGAGLVMHFREDVVEALINIISIIFVH